MKAFLKRSLFFAMAFSAMVVVPAAFAQAVVTATATQTYPEASGQVSLVASCPTGYIATGGGYSQLNQTANAEGGPTVALTVDNGYVRFELPYFYVWADQPTPNGTGWEVTGATGATAPATLNVYAQCILAS